MTLYAMIPRQEKTGYSFHVAQIKLADIRESLTWVKSMPIVLLKVTHFQSKHSGLTLTVMVRQILSAFRVMDGSMYLGHLAHHISVDWAEEDYLLILPCAIINEYIGLISTVTARQI